MGRFHWRYSSGNPGDRPDVSAFVLWCLEAVREGGQDFWGYFVGRTVGPGFDDCVAAFVKDA